MKRSFLFLVMAVLFLTAAFASADGVTFSTAYFTLELPDNWETDMGDLKKEDNTEELGFFGGEMAGGLLAGGAYLVYYENLKDISLWNASAEELKDYEDALLEDFDHLYRRYGHGRADPAGDHPGERRRGRIRLCGYDHQRIRDRIRILCHGRRR